MLLIWEILIIRYIMFKNLCRKNSTTYLLQSNFKLLYSSTRFLSYKVVEEIRSTMGESAGVPLKVVVKILDDFAPESIAESWDNVGLLIEPASPTNVSKILLANDLTEDVMKEALNEKANLIIAYHPPIFRPVKSINNSTWKGRIAATCLENRIAVFSPHTTWDGVQDGVGDWLARCVSIEKCIPIQPGITPNTGMGRTCQLTRPLTVREIIENVKNHIGIPHLRLALGRGKTIDDTVSTMAVCPGSGASVLCGVKADLYLTGEMLHHDVLEAVHNGTHVILCNHSDSERGYLKFFAQKLRNWLPTDVSILLSSRDADPLKTV